MSRSKKRSNKKRSKRKTKSKKQLKRIYDGNGKNSYIFIDFDQTITDYHSNGEPDVNINYWINDESKKRIYENLKLLEKAGYKIIIVTAAKESNVIDYVLTHLPEVNFQDVFGDAKRESFPEYLHMKNKAIKQFNFVTKGINKIDNDTLFWSINKYLLIKKYLEDEKIDLLDKAKLFFIDDTDINVEVLKFLSQEDNINITSVLCDDNINEIITNILNDKEIKGVASIEKKDESFEMVPRTRSSNKKRKLSFTTPTSSTITPAPKKMLSFFTPSS